MWRRHSEVQTTPTPLEDLNMPTAQKETRVEPIELTLFSGRTVRFASEDELIADAVELVERCSMFTPDDAGILRAVWHLIRDRMPATPGEIRLREISRNFWSLSPERPPHPPSPYDEKIEVALTEEAETKKAWEKTRAELDEKIFAVTNLDGSGHVALRGRGGSVLIETGQAHHEVPYPNARHMARANSEAQDALEVSERAEEVFKRARVERNALERRRGRWRAAAHP